MALTQDELDLVVNPALDRICVGQVALAVQTTVEGLAANRHYEPQRDALLRSCVWPFASARANLSVIEILTLDDAPADDPFVAGDTITGGTSGETTTILSVISDEEYEIIDRSGDFEDGEELSNGTDAITCGAGFPIVAYQTPAFEWTYQYLLPTDFLRLRSVYENDMTDHPATRFEIEGRRLLTHYETVSLKYIKKITDPKLFEELFRQVLILRLALTLCYPLAGTDAVRMRQELREELLQIEARARTVAMQENDTTGRQDFNLARYGN